MKSEKKNVFLIQYLNIYKNISYNYTYIYRI